MKYLVAGRVYTNYEAARRYADWLMKVSNTIAPVEVKENPTPEFRSLWDEFDDLLKHPPASPK